MPDIMGEKDILQSDIFAYRSIKNELEKYDTGREKRLSSEYADLATDTAIIKIMEEIEMNTDPMSLKRDIKEILTKFSMIFSVLKQYMITLGQNLGRREQLYDDFEKLHPTKLVQFHKAPLWYQSLVEIASAGGRIHTADFIEMYPERHQRLINLSQDHGFIKYEHGGEIIQLREDICREILFREYATPTTPAETRNKEYYRKTFIRAIGIIGEQDKKAQKTMLKEFKEELMTTKIKDHVTLEWIAPLLRSDIKTIDDFIQTPAVELCRIVSGSISEVSRTILSMICFFERDIRSISIDVFDRGIFKKLDKELSANLTLALNRNGVKTWGDLFDTDISKIKDFGQTSMVNVYRLLSFCMWFRDLVERGGGFYYQDIIDDFPFHESLDEATIAAISKVSKKTPKEYLSIDDRDVVSSYDKGNLTRIPPSKPDKPKRRR